MASQPFIDLGAIDLSKLVVTKEQIYQHLPHRYEFMQVDGIIHMDIERQEAVGLREVRPDEFWVRGHIPGRPLMPGVIMLETAAQLASYLSHMVRPDDRFMGFGGLDNVKFRGAVMPPTRMYVLIKGVEIRTRRTVCDAQGIVDGKLVFEARVTGLPF
jgi:3-hydroxyacyl-[acyl-carrier-protein] dehydratase